MRFFRLRWRSGPLLQDATTNFRVLGDVPEYDLYGLRLEDLPQGNSYLISTAQSSAAFVMGGLFGRPLIADAAGALDAVGSSTAEADVTVNAAGATNIAGEAMLAPTITLDNAGFETGDTTGWTALSGAGMTIMTATPKTGAYYVAVGQELQSASGQTHDIPSGLLTLVDLGLVEMRLAWGGAGFGGDSDAGMPCLEFYDDVGGAGNLIGMHSAPRTDYPTIPAWANLETEAWVPSGARSVRIQLRGVRGGGSENSVYYDDISTRFLQRPNPHIQTQFMLGNETTGWTATTGSTANLVADTRGPWRNASGGLGYETLTHVTSDFVGYRDTEVPVSQIAGVDAGRALVELTAQLQSADTSDMIRVWIEALDATAASLGTVAENSPTAVQASISSVPLRVVAPLPVGTRTLRYWQQMVRTIGTNAIGASRVGIQIEAPVAVTVVEAVMSATAAGALTGAGSGVLGSVLAAAGIGALTAKGYVPDNGTAVLSAAAAASASFSATSTATGKLEAYAPGTADFVSETLSGTASDFAASAAGSFAAAGVAVQNSVLAASALGSSSFAGIQIVHAALNSAALGALSAAGGATVGVAFAATASGAASFAGQGFGVGVMSAAATGAASWTGRVVGTAVFAAAASGQLSGAGGALAPATLTSNALGAADLRATAITQAQLQAAGNGFANHITAATAASAFETAAAGSADFWIDTVAEAVLLTGGAGSFDAHGAYGGSASAEDRIIYIDAPIRKVTFSRADVRMITLDRHDRIVYVGPEVRNVGGG